MKIDFDRQLTDEEKEIIYDKVKNVKFLPYSFSFPFTDIVSEYEESMYDNDILSYLFDFVSREVPLNKDRSYYDKGKRSVVNKYAKKNKDNLFRIQLLSSIFGNGKAATDIATIYQTLGLREQSLNWYKKALVLGKKDEAVEGILQFI